MAQFKQAALVIALFLAAYYPVGCGGGSSATPVPSAPSTPAVPTITSVNVSCPSSLQTGGTVTCTATVQGTSSFNNAVNWTASGGTITASGVFTAPNSAATVTITATSVQDSSKSGTATVVVNPPPPTPKLTNIGAGGDGLVMAVDLNGNIDVAWLNVGDFAVIFAHSLDGGLSFQSTAPMPIDGGAGSGFELGRTPNLQMEVDASGGITILWWARNGLTPIGEAYIIHSTDGVTFTAPINLNIPDSVNPQLVVSPNGDINVAWVDLGSLQSNGVTASLAGPILFITSTNGGNTFSTPITVTAGPVTGSDFTAVSGTQNQIYVFWSSGCTIMDSVSLDGVSFSPPSVTGGFQSTDCSASRPAAEVDLAGNVNVAWVNFNPSANGPELLFTRSADQGSTFSAGLVVVSGDVQAAAIPEIKIAADANGINVVWTSDITLSTSSATSTTSKVLFSHSSDQGNTFSVPIALSLPLSPGMDGADNPSITIDSTGGIDVSWSDDGHGSSPGDFDIYVSRSTDHGATFSTAADLSQATGQVADNSQLASDSRGNSYIVWRTLNSPLNVYFDSP
jgi:hypothetical protein